MPEWVKSRAVVLGTAAVILLVAAVLIFVYAFTSGPSGSSPGTQAAAGSGVVLTVDEALVAEEGQDLDVQGAVLATGGQTVLASTLAESLPPQAVGATLPLQGLDLKSLVGLSTTAGQSGVAEATWSDYSLTLHGVIRKGVMHVQGTPRVVEDSSDSVVLRFSPVSEPIASGDQVWWAMDVTNAGTTPINVVFSSGQRGDVVLSQGDVAKYAWSDGKTFTQAVETVTLQPGKSLPVVLSDPLTLPPGQYDVAAQVTALAGPAGSEAPLPDIVTTLTIH
jgi:hypothetical protein